MQRLQTLPHGHQRAFLSPHNSSMPGASLEVVKELMGHRSIQMTLRYTQLYDTTKRRQYDTAMAQLTHRQALMGR